MIVKFVFEKIIDTKYKTSDPIDNTDMILPIL